MNKDSINFGEILVTIEALNKFTREEINNALNKYKNLDFGDINEYERKSNKTAVRYEGFIIGRYNINNKPLVICTNWYRSHTTVYTGEEYK